MSDLPYPENDARTHWDECWKHRGHHNCAVARIADLQSRLAECERSLECGHPASLLVKSLESDAQWCELCDTRSRRNDAEAMERYYKAELAALREKAGRLLDELDDDFLEQSIGVAEAKAELRDALGR